MAYPELYANAAATTLSGSIASGAILLYPANPGPPFPQSPQFRVEIDSEYLLVTGVTGNVWAVSRGIEGSVAAAHASGAAITQIVTAGGLAGVCGQTMLTGTLGNLPATGVIGRTYRATDTPYLFREGAAGWVAYGPSYLVTPPPALSGWTWVNQGTGATSGSASQVGAGGGPIRLLAPALSTGNARCLAMTAPATGYTITALIVPQIATQNYSGAGIGWWDSVSNKAIFAHLSGDGTTNGVDLQVSYAPSPTNLYTAHYYNVSSLFITSPIWFQIQDDGTNRAVYFSQDGVFFKQLDQRARNYYDGSTTMTPDHVFFFAAPINATYDAAVTLLSWSVTHP